MAFDRLHAMRVFARVAELGSFTRAALSLNLAKANVSTAVSTLERELGVRLLQRTTRALSLTHDGAAYLDRVQRILADIDDLEGSLTRADVALRGRLRVDVPVAIARWLIIPALPEFLARYPDLELQLGVSDRPVDLLEEGVDCVVRGGQPPDSTMVARHIGDMRVLRCATRDYLDRHGRPRDFDELLRHRAVLYFYTRSGRFAQFNYVNAEGQRVELEMRGPFSVNDGDAYLAAGLAGLGVMQAIEFMVREHLASGRMEEILPALPQPAAIPMYVMYPQRRQLSKKVRVFADWVADLLQREFRKTR